jgi:hypothetical protein
MSVVWQNVIHGEWAEERLADGYTAERVRCLLQAFWRNVGGDHEVGLMSAAEDEDRGRKDGMEEDYDGATRETKLTLFPRAERHTVLVVVANAVVIVVVEGFGFGLVDIGKVTDGEKGKGRQPNMTVLSQVW